jgi:hypothetical protein
MDILLVTHRRSEYLRLSLNSLLYCKSKESKLHIVLSGPDAQTIQIVSDLLDNNESVEAVYAPENLSYGVTNFGGQFFGLSHFIHFEDDFIIPESFKYFYPNWEEKMWNLYRENPESLVCLRTSLENSPHESMRKYPVHRKFKSLWEEGCPLWDKYEIVGGEHPPIGGNGMLIDFEKFYKGPIESPFCRTDYDHLRKSRVLIVSACPVYHLGANQMMDGYKQSFANRSSVPVPKRDQLGIDMRTKESKIIDLSLGSFFGDF